MTEPVTVATVDLPNGGASLAGDELLRDIVAVAVLDTLPAAVCFSPGVGAKAGARKALAALAPKDLELFDLAFLPRLRLWRASLRGKAARDASGWKVTLDARDEPGNARCLYGQRRAGRGTVLNALAGKGAWEDPRHPKLEASRGESDASPGVDMATLLKSSTLDDVADGYVGLRYGRELVNPATATLPPTNLLGLLAEFRGGWAKGLRVYWDYVPREADHVAGNSLYLSWQRVEIGYGLGVEPTNGVTRAIHLRRAEVAPKIGVWSVNANLPIVDDTGVVRAEHFDTSNDLGFGYEVSAEFVWPLVFFRPWAGYDRSFAAFGQKLSSSVSATRYGLDAFFKSPGLGFGDAYREHVSFLLFAFQENLTLSGYSNGSGTILPLADQPGGQPFTLGLSTVYGGGGVSISW